MKHLNKAVWLRTGGVCLLAAGMTWQACQAPAVQPAIIHPTEQTDSTDSWEEAETTPFGRYPETVTYTLGKITSENNGNMPQGDTYEDNNYTRYLKSFLNVQNEDVLEGLANQQYEQLEKMSISEGAMPDIMVVTSQEILDMLVEQDMIEDLTDAYENCTSDRVKRMYESYGSDKLDAVTYDGKMMAFPETEAYTGPALLWLRKDWMDQLGLKEPQTMEEAMEIIRTFVRENPGNHPNGNVGLVFDPSLIGQSDKCFSVEPIFENYHSYPQKWIPDGNGGMVYGSVTNETRTALEALAHYYKEGILDQSFMLSNSKNLAPLLADGECGAFFGWWWAPNDPLSAIYDKNAEWKPYLFKNTESGIETSLPYGRHYCVVAKKGFEHPEIIPKILSALFDYARYDGREQAEEVGEYLGMNVNQSATPFVINIDYSDAIFRTTESIRLVLENKRNYDSLNVLERGYYNSCLNYLDDDEPQAFEWAAYASRITAVETLKDQNIIYVNEGYTQRYDQLTTDELMTMERKAFIMIITGEKPIEYFDSFVNQWYENGGKELTEEANQLYQEAQ